MWNGKKKTFAVFTAVIFFIIAVHFLGWLSFVENLFKQVFNVGIGVIYGLDLTLNKTEESDNFLCSNIQTELNNIKIDQSKLTLLEDENKELRDQLKFFSNKAYGHVGAQVVGRNLESFGNAIILNRGKESGIAVGNPVIVSGGVLVGKIIKAEDNLSVARLISDDQSKTAATIINKDKSIGLVEGGYGISVRMNLIPQNEIINSGDLIITSGLEASMPRGLLIGTVEAVEKEPYQPFQRAVLTPLVNLNKIFLVSVITSLQ